MIMDFSEKLNQGRFLITSEIGPPKGTDLEKTMEEAELLRDRVDAFNVTDLQSSVMRTGSLATCRLLFEKGLEPIFQVTCRDRNRLALQSDLLSAYILGIKNILALTGDHTTLGDHPQAKPVFDLDSVSLLEAARNLTEGRDMAGNELSGTPEFCAGAVVNPGADPLEPQLLKMEKKVEAGARFFQTQAVYDIDIFEKFVRSAEKLKTPVMGGIVLLKSAGMAKFMNANVAGVTVPQKYIDMMAKAPKADRPRISVEIAAELVRKMKPMCRGIHFMPLGWEKYVPEIIEKAELS